MRRIISLVAALSIMLSFVLPGVGQHPVSAAGSSRDVYVASYGGVALVPGACLRLSPYSNVGCDLNRDGYVQFSGMPTGTYTIVYSSVPAGYAVPADRTMTVPRGGTTPFYWNVQLASTTGTVDVSIVAYDDATGLPLTDACFSLRGYSNMGCDVNRDGQVEFADIP